MKIKNIKKCINKVLENKKVNLILDIFDLIWYCITTITFAIFSVVLYTEWVNESGIGLCFGFLVMATGMYLSFCAIIYRYKRIRKK